MQVNFAAILEDLPADSLFRIMSDARNDADYYLTTLMPEREMPDYSVQVGTMSVRATMAGLVGMDSPYPEGGAIDISKFLEESAKIAIALGLPEKVLRVLQRFAQEYALGIRGAGAPDPASFMEGEALNFFEKVIVQALTDTREWLRGQSLNGTIDWTFNKKRLEVDYGFPAGHVLTARTGTSAYNGTASKFWDDMRDQKRLLRKSARIIRLAHPDTIDDVVYNEANALRVLEDTDELVRVQKLVKVDGAVTASDDARDVVTIIKYGGEGEVLDPSSVTETKTILVPFIGRGKIYAVGSGVQRGYRVGEGSTPEPRSEMELGYTHLAPTVEGDGAMGDWGRLYTPQDRPWSLRGEGVSNCLPVIEGNERVAVARTTGSYT